MPNNRMSCLYRRDWTDDESDNENDQLMDGIFGRKEPDKKPDGNCGEPPKKAPEKRCPEPQKPEAKKNCPCKSKEKKPAKKSQSMCKKMIKKAKKSSSCKKPAKKMKEAKCGSTPRSRNPFIIFFLTMLAKQKNKRAADVAREAGKQWCCMDPKSKEMYQKLAKAERMRRQRENKCARKRKCN